MAPLLLVIGDLHIPLRVHDLPLRFKRLLLPGKIQQILCTGNICDGETWEYLRGIAPDLRGVRGDHEEVSGLPASLVITHGSLRIGLIHGHQVVPLGDTEALSAIARKMDVDILVSGGTHRFEAYEYDGRFFVNPGSATGAFSPFWTATPAEPVAEAPTEEDTKSKEEESKARPAAEGSESKDAAPPASADAQPPTPIPSFALLDIQGAVVITYVYQLVDGEVKVEKIEYRLQSLGR